jgi:phospholipid transport system substrate-binding protein
MTPLAAFPSRLRTLAAAFVLSTALATEAAAVQPASAMAFVKELSSTVLKQLTGTEISDSDRVKRLRKLLVEHFDVPVVGKFVLGVYFRRTSEAQFKEFLKLYEVYVAHNYSGLFKKYQGETIDVLREQPGGNDTTLVFARINQVSGPPVAMDMRVHKKNGAYKALDLKIEGVSMPLTHRKQFASVIARSSNGVQGLLDALKRATDRFEAETPSQ